MPELLELVKNKIVRAIDPVIIQKYEDGHHEVMEMQQLAPDLLARFDPLEAEISGIIQVEDIASVAEEGAARHPQQQKWAQQQHYQAYQQGVADAHAQQYTPPPQQDPAPVEPAPGADLTAQLQQLAQLHKARELSTAVFAAAKQKLLAG